MYAIIQSGGKQYKIAEGMKVNSSSSPTQKVKRLI